MITNHEINNPIKTRPAWRQVREPIPTVRLNGVNNGRYAAMEMLYEQDTPRVDEMMPDPVIPERVYNLGEVGTGVKMTTLVTLAVVGAAAYLIFKAVKASARRG